MAARALTDPRFSQNSVPRRSRGRCHVMQHAASTDEDIRQNGEDDARAKRKGRLASDSESFRTQATPIHGATPCPAGASPDARAQFNRHPATPVAVPTERD
jgi:hypothetical protein